jgi:hypothetical protein
MAKVVGYDTKLNKRVTCSNCTAIIEYKPCEVQDAGYKDEGCNVEGVVCPECRGFCRTNP